MCAAVGYWSGISHRPMSPNVRTPEKYLVPIPKVGALFWTQINMDLILIKQFLQIIEMLKFMLAAVLVKIFVPYSLFSPTIHLKPLCW